MMNNQNIFNVNNNDYLYLNVICNPITYMYVNIGTQSLVSNQSLKRIFLVNNNT
jgi:hypothetical protein